MKRYRFMIGIIVTLLLAALACGAEATSTPTSVPAPTSTPEPTTPPVATATAVPTAPPAATATTVPAATPSPTATTVPIATTAVPATPVPTATAPPAATPIPATEQPLVDSTITIGPSKDNTLYEQPDGSLSNGVGQHIFAGHNNGGLARRGVIAFDIAGNVPAGAVINSVALTLNMSRTQSPGEDIQLHRLLTDWGEGASDASANEGGGTAAATGDATWIHTRFDAAEWQTPGGDFSAAASATRQVSGVGQYVWGSTDQMVADVQAWVDDPSTSFGWLLMGNESETRTAKRFDSKETPEEANRPSLTIDFTSRGGN